MTQLFLPVSYDVVLNESINILSRLRMTKLFLPVSYDLVLNEAHP
jgi:hypothetical protein